MAPDGIEMGVSVGEFIERLSTWFGLGHMVDSDKYTAPGDYFLRMNFRVDEDGKQFLRLCEGGQLIPTEPK